jgi:hypothetical protein
MRTARRLLQGTRHQPPGEPEPPRDPYVRVSLIVTLLDECHEPVDAIISVGVGTLQPDDAPMVWVTPERPGRGGQPQPLVNICFDTVNQVDALMAALKEARRKFVADARGKVRHG